ncbi:MAG: Calx-beta domain-containing protein, partial [Acidimicrobiia bacterium]
NNTLGAQTAHTVTITDDDDVLVAFSAASSPVNEPGVASVDVAITFTGGGTLQGDVTVDVTDLLNGSATPPVDYTFTNPTTLTFPAGVSSGAVETATITVVEDAIDENDETIDLSLGNVTGRATLGALTAHTVTIADNDTAVVSIDDVSVAEGDTGTAIASFTVTLSTTAAFDITLDYTTTAGTATAGTDYTTAAGVVTLAAGDTSEPIDVTVIGETVDEANETFTVDLSNISTGQGDISGTGTILDDDGPPTLSVSATDADRPEGADAPAPTVFTFTVTLLPASGQTVTVDYTTADGSATAGDYISKSGMLTFTPGQTSKTVTVNILNDGTDEPAETFFVDLSGETNAVVGTAQATGTIRDDDNVAPAHDLDCGPDGTFICFFVKDGGGTSTVEFDPGETVHVSGNFNDPGATDIHSVTVDWGDGTAPETTVLTVGSRSYAVTHQYFAGGTFTLTLDLQDADGGIETLSGPLLVPVFTDIENSVHKDNIVTIWVNGITQGCNPPDNTLYCPADFVTRAQMATFLVRVLGLIPWPDNGPFTDHIASVHRQNINAIRVAGITAGCNPPQNTLYCPNDFVTRAQMATFIVRALG